MSYDAPIERYLELGAAVVQSAADDYINAKKRLPRLQAKAEKEKKQLDALKRKYANTKAQLNRAERDINESRAFFLSDRFDIFMPSSDGEKFLELIDEKIEREMNPEATKTETKKEKAPKQEEHE